METRSLAKQSAKKKILNPIWLSVSEAAKLGGVGDKTIREPLFDLNSSIALLRTVTN